MSAFAEERTVNFEKFVRRQTAGSQIWTFDRLEYIGAILCNAAPGWCCCSIINERSVSVADVPMNC
jgi:hypothetical protein